VNDLLTLTLFAALINARSDVDPAINSFAAQNWTSHLDFEEVEAWRPWTVDSCRRMGGYITKYAGNFHFLTIRGAGHMVC
jgi:serine carboxypeptidase-like clade I